MSAFHPVSNATPIACSRVSRRPSSHAVSYVAGPNAARGAARSITPQDGPFPVNHKWPSEVAYAINDLGQIVGSGRRRGQEHAILLTPVKPRRENVRAHLDA